jgi:polysaccharide biosynthesis protein PelG
MAGIGFELRRHLRKESFTSLLRAYVAAGVIGSGPWIISISSMLFIGFVTRRLEIGKTDLITPFLATVTHLMATSLIVSGLVQLMFTRFVADRLFEKKEEVVSPNLNGILLLTTIVSGGLASLVAIFAFDEVNYAYRMLVVVAFVLLCDIWLLSVFLSGMKAYGSILLFFGIGYGLTSVTALALSRYGVVGYLAGFCAGHAVMFFSMFVKVLRQYPSEHFIQWQFLDGKKVHVELSLTGFLFNVAVWADKFVFWANSVTSEKLIGPIRYSVVYDVPIFIAYLSLIPGMAVLFVRIETDFAEAYEQYFTAVTEGASLTEVQRLRGKLVGAARAGVYDIFRVQGLAVAVLLLGAPQILSFFGIPSFYLYLFRIDVVAVGFQVVLLGIFTILFYLDYRKLVLYLTIFFAIMNLGLSIMTLYLGPRFYGFGFATAAALTSLVSLGALSRKLDRLDYETFMR